MFNSVLSFRFFFYRALCYPIGALSAITRSVAMLAIRLFSTICCCGFRRPGGEAAPLPSAYHIASLPNAAASPTASPIATLSDAAAISAPNATTGSDASSVPIPSNDAATHTTSPVATTSTAVTGIASPLLHAPSFDPTIQKAHARGINAMCTSETASLENTAQYEQKQHALAASLNPEQIEALSDAPHVISAPKVASSTDIKGPSPLTHAHLRDYILLNIAAADAASITVKQQSDIHAIKDQVVEMYSPWLNLRHDDPMIEMTCVLVDQIRGIVKEQREAFRGAYYDMVHRHPLWTEPYRAMLFDQPLVIQAAGPPCSSAEPRNRRDNLSLPSFFEVIHAHTLYPAGDQGPMFRSAIATEFGWMGDPDTLGRTTRENVKQLLLKHGEAYLRLHPDALEIPFMAITLLTPDRTREVLYTLDKIADADNEAGLWRAYHEALQFFQHTHLMINGQERRFNISMWNIPCNNALDTFSQTMGLTSPSIPEAVQASQEAFKRLKTLALDHPKPPMDNAQKELHIETQQVRQALLENYQIHHDASWETLRSRQEQIIATQDRPFMEYEAIWDLIYEIEMILSHPLREWTTAQQGARYALPARVMLLSRKLGLSVHFGCRSGKDRTGLAMIDYLVLCTLFQQRGYIPSFRDPLENRKEIEPIVYRSGGNAEVGAASNGCPIGLNIGGCAPLHCPELTQVLFAAAKAFKRP